MVQKPDPEPIRRLWQLALAEDGADSDVTSIVSVPDAHPGRARLIAREPGVFAGQVIFDIVAHLHPITIEAPVADGETFEAGQTLATFSGPHRLLLGVERTLLNFLQRLCGIATLTRAYVDAVAGTDAKIYDTRKTIPGWRLLDKYAVRCGRGFNHRMGLHDAVLIKDNHLAGLSPAQLAGAIGEMITKAAQLDPPPTFFQCEVDSLQQLDELIRVNGVDVILLDNFSTDEMREAVARRDAAGLKGRVDLEASGGVQLGQVRDIAETGVDRIAIGAITHSAAALDLGIDAG